MTEAKVRILFVDDDEHLLTTLGDFLTFQGFETIKARNAEEALAYIKKNAVDLILLDIWMPGIGGVGFLKQITSASGRLQFPVLVLSARSAIREFVNTVGVDGFLQKPCDEVELIRKIRETLSSQDKRMPGEPLLRRKVLLGEDDADMTDTLAKAFSDAGYYVNTAASGPELMEKAVAGDADLIVAKLLLAEMNGDQVASVLHAMPRTRPIPVLVYDSSSLSDSHRQRLGSVPHIRRFVASDNSHQLLRAAAEILE